MADRYWVGGSGAWTDTSRWAATSGGTPGASVPTFSDNVFIDGNSDTGADIVISQNSAGETNDFTITGVGYNIVFSVTLSFDYQFTALTTRGNVYWTENVSWGSFAFRGFYVDFQAPASTTRTVEITSTITGTWDLALTSGSGATLDLDITSWGTRGRHGVLFQGAGTINLNASVIRGSSVTFSNGTTINAGTSTTGIINGDGNIIFSYTIGATCNFNPDTATTQITTGAQRTRLNLNGKSIYNLLYDGDTAANFGFGQYLEIQTAAVVTNDFTCDCSTNSKFILQSNNLTVGGAFSVTNTVPQSRYCLWLPNGNLSYTLTLNGTTSLTDYWMSGVYVRGSAAPISGTRLGDLGRNRGINFGAPRTVYRIGTGNWNDNQWSDTSGGSPNVNFIPLPQDTAVYDNNTTAGTQNINGAYISSIDASARSTALTLTFTSVNIYGDLILSSSITTAGSGTFTFTGDEDISITSAGKAFSFNLTCFMFGGTLSLNDALTLNNTFSKISMTSGTFDTNGYAVYTSKIESIGSFFPCTLKLNSSSVTLVDPTNQWEVTNSFFTLDSGTSTVSVNATSPLLLSGGTFYNVSLQCSGSNPITLRSSFTFNNLTIVPRASGVQTFNILSGVLITVNGTLTLAGGSPTRRIRILPVDSAGNILYSGIINMNVAAISANDTDFFGVAMTGAASSTLLTRCGNVGGTNSGITFPSPKTVYWNLAGSQSWIANGWASSSGGSPDVNNLPLAQDTAIFDEAGSAGTVTFNGDYYIGTVDMSSRTSAMTLAGSVVACGNWTFGSGVTPTTGGITFFGSGTSTKTITSNGKAFGGAVDIYAINQTYQLSGAFSCGAFALTAGTLDVGANNVTASTFGSGGLTRTLKMGSGLWTLSGTGTTVWNINATSMILEPQTANILFYNTADNPRSFNGAGFSYNKFDIGGTLGYSLSLNGNNLFTELASSTPSNPYNLFVSLGAQMRIGKISINGHSGNPTTIAGSGSIVTVGSASSGVDWLIVNVPVSGTAEFYAGANSSGTAGVPVYYTTKPADSTRYWVGGTGNWSDTNRWSTGSGGAGGASVPRSHDSVVFDSSSNATAYTATIDAVTGGNRCKALTVAGPASGNLTLAGTTALVIHDDVTLPATGLTLTYSGAITLSGSTSGKTFVSNGVTLNSTITVDGVGAEWALGDAFALPFNVGLTVNNGSIDFDSYNVTLGALTSNVINKRTIDFGSGTITFSSGTTFNLGTAAANAANLTIVSGTSTIVITSAQPTFDGNGKTFYNVSFTGATTSPTTINGSNTFNNLSFSGITAAGTRAIILSADQVVNGTFTCTAGTNATMRLFMQSSVFGTVRTLTCNAVSLTDVDFRDITIAGSAAPASGTRLGNAGGNTGITFSSKNVYWNLAGTQNWNANGWAPSSGASPATTSFPLAQDTAIFDDAGAAGTVNFASTAYNFPAIDASARTTSMTLGHNGSQTLHGSYTLGSGVTVSGTSGQTFAGRNTQTFTSAGKTITFPITVNSPNGTFQLGDATTSSNSLTLTLGTINLNNYNLTITSFSSTNSNVRTFTFGSGVCTLSSTGTIWNATTPTNFTVNRGTGGIILSNTSASARTFAGGGLSYPKLTIGGTTGSSTLTISGNNSFAEMASTKTVAHTINIGLSKQTVNAWSITGTSGNVVTLNGNTTSQPGTWTITNTNPIQNLDYLSINTTGLIPYEDVWYVGTNSTSTSQLGAIFAVAPPPPIPVSAGEMFLLFM